MAKGLLISYAGYPCALSSLFPDNGLASLAAVLRAEGHECTVLDLNTAELMGRLVEPAVSEALERILPEIQSAGPETIARLVELSGRIEERGTEVAGQVGEEIARRCCTQGVEFVGFKLWSGDGFEASARIAERIKRRCPGIRLFAGGPAVHYSGHVAAAEAPIFDAVVDGDGEEAMLALARCVEGRLPLDEVPNRVLPSGASTGRARAMSDLATLPLPEYGAETYPAVAAGQKLRLFSIDESRGCPMRCAFCINWCIEGTRWRTRSADQVLQEIRQHVERHGSRAFRLAGTYSPPKLVREICDRVIAEQLDVSFGLSLHASGAGDGLFERLREAGCFGVFTGVESGSDVILDRAMNKSVTRERLQQTLTQALRAGLFTVGSFIFPAPFETPETEAQTRGLIDDVFAGQLHASVIVTFPALLPRTGWWNNRDRFGFELQIDDDSYRRLLLRYKIRHLLPATLWEPLPYRLDGRAQRDLARRTAALQAWVHDRGIAVNVPDHDAQVGDALGHSTFELAAELRRIFFVGDAVALAAIVDRANEVFSP